METTSQRVYLSYQGATFYRARILFAITGVILLILLFVKFPRQTPPPGAVAGPPIASILLGFAGVLCLIYAIMDALFVAGARYGSEKSCDQENLYLNQEGQDNVIPLASITAIRLAGRMSNGTRGAYSVYAIEYDYNGRDRRVEIAVYSRTRDSFNLFKERVQRKNPSVEIKNWYTSLDGVIRLFRKKPPQ